MEATHPSLSVVVPAFNEALRLPQTLRELRQFLDPNFSACEVLVVDDGSKDGTDVIVEEHSRTWPKLELLRLPRHRGKGAAVRHGCLHAKCDFVLFMDADHPTPIEQVDSFLQPLIEGECKAVIGLRTYSGDEPRWQGLVGLSLLLLAHLIVFEQSVVDSQCGFKCFTREAARQIFSISRVDGGMFDVEILHLMQLLAIPFRFQTVQWRNKGDSRLSIQRRMLSDPIDLIAIRLRSVLGIYPRLDKVRQIAHS